MKPPNGRHPKWMSAVNGVDAMDGCHECQGVDAINGGKSVMSHMDVTIIFKLPPTSGHLSMTDKFFKARRCPLFRGSTVFPYFLSS